MKILFFLTVMMSFFANPDLVAYKLILNSGSDEKEIKTRLFDKILADFAANQKRHLAKIDSWTDEEVMSHFGKITSDFVQDLEKTVQTPEKIRQTLSSAIVKRTKELARQAWVKIEAQSLEDLKSEFIKTIEFDTEAQKETSDSIAQMTEKKIEGNHPSSPWTRSFYSNQYYNYYGYNYLYNYPNYSYAYPTNSSYGYYTPIFHNGYYQYVRQNYYPGYYQTWYYPVHNRTTSLMNTGLFGLVAVGSFVDWLLYN